MRHHRRHGDGAHGEGDEEGGASGRGHGRGGSGMANFAIPLKGGAAEVGWAGGRGGVRGGGSIVKAGEVVF